MAQVLLEKVDFYPSEYNFKCYYLFLDIAEVLNLGPIKLRQYVENNNQLLSFDFVTMTMGLLLYCFRGFSFSQQVHHLSVIGPFVKVDYWIR